MPQSQTNQDFSARSLEVRAKSINEESRTVQATLSTETPVMMYDYARGEMIPEVLLTSGMEFPKSRQVPLLDSHNRYSTKEQVGSVREITREEDSSVGTLSFAAGREWDMVREGHVTDVSVGYEVKKRTYVEAGKTKEISGKTFVGPVNVVTKWRLREVSITPIGADELAKMRGYTPAQESEETMDTKLRELCVELGMPADATEEQAREFYEANFPAWKERLKAPAKKEEPVDFRKIIGDAMAEQERMLKEKREAFRKQVDLLLDVAGRSDLAERAYQCEDEKQVAELLKAERQSEEPRIVAGPAQRDKHLGAIRSAMTSHVIQSAGLTTDKAERYAPKEQRAAGSEAFRYAMISDLARACLEADGVDVRGLSKDQVCRAAMGDRTNLKFRSDVGYHQTGSFASVTLDAVNKSMMIGYQEAPSTWRICFRQGTSVPDFKTKHEVVIGAIPNVPIWPGIDAPQKASFADAKESYAVECRSSMISFGYKLLINDDMSALTRVPQMYGAAMARTLNATAWAQITGNPTLRDGVSLFSAASGARKRSNLTTGSGAPSVSTLQTLTSQMRQMRGENTPEGNESDDILNLEPRFLIGPSTLETTIKQLVLSAYDPSSANMAYNTASGLVPVIEPLLDASSTTAWYVAASPSQIDTVEVSFLQGHESPIVRNWMDEETLAQNYAILQTFAAKAMNHRGLQKHNNA